MFLPKCGKKINRWNAHICQNRLSGKVTRILCWCKLKYLSEYLNIQWRLNFKLMMKEREFSVKHYSIFKFDLKCIIFSKYLYQYKPVLEGIYMIYLSLYCECQLHYWASSRASYHLQGKYRIPDLYRAYCINFTCPI